MPGCLDSTLTYAPLAADPMVGTYAEEITLCPERGDHAVMDLADVLVSPHGNMREPVPGSSPSLLRSRRPSRVRDV